MIKIINVSMLSTVVLLATLIFNSPKSHAVGIPTVDVAALVQNLVEYSQQLNDYAEQLYQTQLEANQYVQKLLEMEQIYREYEHTLEQIKGIKDYIDNTEWVSILDQIEVDFPLNPLDLRWDDWGVDIYTDDGVLEVDEEISNAFKRVRELEDVYGDIETVFESEEMRDKKREDARRHYLRSRQATEQKYAAEVFIRESDHLEEALQRIKSDRTNIAMDDESELRTLQIIAMQQELELHYKKAQHDVLIKSFEMSNQESIRRNNIESFVYDMMLLDQLEVANRVPYKATDRNNTTNF